MVLEKKAWDFLNENSEGMFDGLTNQIQNLASIIIPIIMILAILYYLYEKNRK